MARTDPKAHGIYPILCFLMVTNLFGAMASFSMGAWLIGGIYYQEGGHLVAVRIGAILVFGGIVSFSWNLADTMILMFCPNKAFKWYHDLLREEYCGNHRKHKRKKLNRS